MSISPVTENAAAALASKFINHTNRHIFLTGKAGTGKTTFLRYIIKHTHKNAVIAAPTGIAAINAGGVTLHSLFQLPFGAFVPVKAAGSIVGDLRINDPHSLVRNLMLRGNKRKLLQEIELLIIDEVSMLRADLLDAVDAVLRYVRRQRNLPFGGVQILFIGDLLQLPPVVKEHEWRVLQKYYNSQWFFEAHALQHHKPLYVELEKIYRQQDQTFISILNGLRNNDFSEEDIEILNQHYKPDYKPAADENIIYLTTHNAKADEINRTQLKTLEGKTHYFGAEIDGEFAENNYPVEQTLELKEGAQVMFLKNDPTGEQRFFNGKIGKVKNLGGDGIEVAFDDGSPSVSVERHEWENIKYKLNESTNEVEENVVGTFRHYPLKLAWAITVHKSQGLTFEKAIIDIGKAFAPGQVYVALSRLTSLDGLVLTSPINYRSISEDKSVAAYAETKNEQDPLEEALERESSAFLRDFTLNCFDFSALQKSLHYHLQDDSTDGQRSTKQKNAEWAVKLQNDFMPHLATADKFCIQLRNITSQEPIDLEQLKSRIEAAQNYYAPILKEVSANILAQAEKAKKEKGTKGYIAELTDLESGFFKQQQLIAKAAALVKSALEHTELTAKDVLPAEDKEQRKEQVEKVLVKSRERRSRYGSSAEKKPKKEKGLTYKETLKMYREGKNITEIATERGFAESTITGHLARFVKTGEVAATELVPHDKLDKIIEAINEISEDEGLGSAKQKLGEDYSYGELRIAVAHKEWKEGKV